MSFDLTDVRVLDFILPQLRESDRPRFAVLQRESPSGDWFMPGGRGRGIPTDQLLMWIEQSGPDADPRILAWWGGRQYLPKLPKVTP